MTPKYYLVSRKGKTLTACIEYVKSRNATLKRLDKYARSFGGVYAGFSRLDGRLLGVYFKGDQPEGWRKKDKVGYSSPKKKSPDYKQFSEMEKLPCPHKFSADLTGAPCQISYTVRGGSGSTHTSGAGQWHHTSMLWMSNDGPFLLRVPDINGQIDEMRGSKKTFKPTPESWELSLTGCKEILIEEWQLMVARNKQKKAA